MNADRLCFYTDILSGYSSHLSFRDHTYDTVYSFILIGYHRITVGEIVDEQRRQVGMTKALGFRGREILSKYLLFSVSATLAGIVSGILLARFLLEGIALRGYNDYYALDISSPKFYGGVSFAVMMTGVMLAVCATALACRRLLRESANRLMQPEIPGGLKRSATGKKSSLPLYTRLILRNIITDRKRVAVTVVSVAGCCSLIVIGFTLKHAVDGSVTRQYSEVVSYDTEIPFEYSYNADEIAPILEENGTDYVTLYDANILTMMDDVDIAKLLVGDLSEIGSFYRFNDWKTGGPVTPADDGIFIHRRFAETYGLDVGDEFVIAVEMTERATVRVAGVFENYIGFPMVMSEAYYESLYGEPREPNMFFVRLNGADIDELKSEIEEKTWWRGDFEPSDKDRDVFEASTDVINSVVLLFIVMAAFLAGVVLLDLTDIQVMQRKSELTVMRVNGFTLRETIGYLVRENAATTFAGIVLGLAAGAAMSYGIVRALEQSFVQFDRRVSPLALILGALMTVIFALIVNAFVLRKIRHLKLTDVCQGGK